MNYFIMHDILYLGSDRNPIARVRRNWRRKNIFIKIVTRAA